MSWHNTLLPTVAVPAQMTALGYQHAYEAGLEHGRFPATSRPSRSNVSFLPVFVGFTPGSGPTVKWVRTAARDPLRTSMTVASY
jgi:hypothetical protein